MYFLALLLLLERFIPDLHHSLILEFGQLQISLLLLLLQIQKFNPVIQFDLLLQFMMIRFLNLWPALYGPPVSLVNTAEISRVQFLFIFGLDLLNFKIQLLPKVVGLLFNFKLVLVHLILFLLIKGLYGFGLY